MIAVPLSRDNVSAHFMKATQFALFNQRGELQAYLENPAMNGEGCQEKKRCIAQLLEAGVSTLLVKNIGQKSLAKLLAHSVKVYELRQRCDLTRLFDVEKIALTHPSMGRACRSTQHDCQSKRKRMSARLIDQATKRSSQVLKVKRVYLP